MASFVNFNNKKEQSLNTYSIRTVKESLFLAETKNLNKIEKLVEGIEGRLTLSEALVLFSDKLNAMSVLSHVNANTIHVNEGQFSWITYDTDVQIGSEKENTIDVYMFDNLGNQWHEKKYDGYGVFGNMDYYELLATMNGYSEEDLEDKAVLKAIRAMGKAEMRDIGITLAFEPKKLKTKAKGNKVLFPALVENPKFSWKRHDFTEEAESDPNQSWYQEPEYDDDYEDDDDYEQGWYESFMTEAQKVNEWGSSDQSIFLDAMHKDAGKPKKMPSPFDSKLRQAAEDAVDFYWEDWDEYKSDRDSLVDDAVRSYLRKYFKKDFEMMVKMFEEKTPIVKENRELMKIDSYLNTKDESVLLDFLDDAYGNSDDRKTRKEWENARKDLGYSELVDYAIAHAENFGMDLQDVEDAVGVYESEVTEAKFVKEFDEAVLKATTQEEVLEIYPNAEFFIGKSDHFFGEFDENLFFKAYYTKGQKEFEIKSIYSEKNSNYVHLYNESVVTEAKGFKNTTDFEKFLIEIDGMGEAQIKKIMGKDYIDTPGYYQDEKGDYDDVEDFMRSNMGTKEFEKLESWWENNVAESVVTEGSSKEFEEALAHYAEIGGHSDNGRRELVDAYWKLLNKKQQDEYFMALAHAQYAKNNKVGWAKEVTEKTYNKKSLMKAMKADDGMIQLGNGQEYVIYAYGNGNDDNDDMWGDKTIFALDQDGEEHEVEYSDIVSYNENKLTWHGLKESLGIETINEKDDAGTHLDNLADLVGKAKDFFAIGKELKSGKYKYDYSDSMMPMYTIKADGFKFAILNKRYVDGGDREVGEIAIGLMESVNASFMNERSYGQNSDDALILIQQALKGMKNMKAEIKGDTVIIHNKAKDEFTYSLNDGGDVQEFIDELEESVINEGRSINKISKEFGETVANMKKTVDEWKTAEGDRKAELLEKLRELNKMKANLEKELDEAVSGKDKNITLALGEE